MLRINSTVRVTVQKPLDYPRLETNNIVVGPEGIEPPTDRL